MFKIHPLADVKTTKIGSRTMIWQFCVILEDAVIGEDCNICAQVFIENNVMVGNNVTIKSGVQLWDGITIEDYVFIGPNVTFTNDLVPRSKKYLTEFAVTIVKIGASIGANSTIICGNTLGEYCFVGAGSLVNKDIPPYHVYYGSPAKHMGYITKDAVILSLELKDKKGNAYVIKDKEPILYI
jgi:UDP-2-acetamido-3-amino-2,3-dideoxy-glucuronate N-acetyltransferase